MIVMDNMPPGLAEKNQSGGGLSNGPSFRRSGSSRPVSTSNASDGVPISPTSQFHTVVFVIHKDDTGYGMKVSGDNPVYVQSVKEGGAAEKAGLHSGDMIIKVNGVDVTQSTHTEVVSLIRASTRVELTVHQHTKLPSHQRSSIAMSPTGLMRPLQHHHSTASRTTTDRITSPQPVDMDKKRQLENQRVHTIKLMLEKEQRYVDSLKSDLVKCSDQQSEAKISLELKNAERRVNTIHEQLLNLTPHNEHGVTSSASSMLGHHRTKSNPDPLGTHIQSVNLSTCDASKRLIASESMQDLRSKRTKVQGGSWDVDSPGVTPPGTPPPPYRNNSDVTDCLDDDDAQVRLMSRSSLDASPVGLIGGVAITSTPITQIMSMEEDDMSDQEVSQLEDHGPFKSLSKLWEHHAHLAVFMNYVISNSDPSSLLFYLVTDLYKEGNAKEMKKWAYEIHSSFLVPGAPLRLNNVDENVASEIDDVLLKESDKEEKLRKVFFKARTKAKEELNEQLADFQQKRTAGLGTLFGPPDTQLEESIQDKNKEMKIIESILVPKLDPYLEEIEGENVDMRRFTTVAALGTIIAKVFGVRGPHTSAALDRCPTFVSKDKSLKTKLLIGKSRKLTIRGHQFVAHQYYTVTYCNHCQLIIWGIGPQGYQCTNCNLNVHRHKCVRIVEENCPGPLTKKERSDNRISKLMERIRPEREARRKPSSLNFGQAERNKKQSDDDGVGDNFGDRPVSGLRGVDRRPDTLREGEEKLHNDDKNHDDDHVSRDISHHVSKVKNTSTNINRSESYRERIPQKKRERRKTSDPNLSKTNDAELDNQGALTYNTNSGSSSNSSLSTRSLDSPSAQQTTDNSNMVTATQQRTQEAVTVTLTPSTFTPFEQDSDTEAEADPPDWTRGVDDSILTPLSSREKKRQEVINELFHTERSHVRNLKVLDHVFARAMYENQILPVDQLQLLFPNLNEMLGIHTQFNNSMKAKRREGPVVGDVGDILLTMFDGDSGDSFKKVAATFCAKQQIALESLKERRKKDAKLNNFLTEAEGNSACRRLQLKDMLPAVMQRLTKYPLLFENLSKYSTSGSDEQQSVQLALDRSKEILNFVNQSVKAAEDQQRLAEIQRRLDKSAFDKVDNPITNEFKNLDLRQHKLIYEGSLNWRIGNRPKFIDIHVLLLDDIIILLQKQDEKFVLKFYNMNMLGGATPPLSPIVKVSTVLVRDNAVDKTALYLVNTSQNLAQIYDLVASSPAERKIWFKHISEAAESYKHKDGKSRRGDLTTAQPISSPDNDNTDRTKENEESTSSVDASVNDTTGRTEGVGDDTSQDAGDGGGGGGGGDNNSNNSSSQQHNTTTTTPTPQGSPSNKKQVNNDQTSSPSQRRRIEPLRLTTVENNLIPPTEVTISQRSILTAESVLTPIEQLRLKDEAIRKALLEKQQLVADILHVPREEFETISELAGEPSSDKEATELVLAAVSQANRLASILNDSLCVTEDEALAATSEVLPGYSPIVGRRRTRLPGVPVTKLQQVSNALNVQLTQLLRITKERDVEREKLRKEVQKSREQIHVLHESHRKLTSAPAADCRQQETGAGHDESGDVSHIVEEPLQLQQQQQPDLDDVKDGKSDSGNEVFVDALSEELQSTTTTDGDNNNSTFVDLAEGDSKTVNELAGE